MVTQGLPVSAVGSKHPELQAGIWEGLNLKSGRGVPWAEELLCAEGDWRQTSWWSVGQDPAPLLVVVWPLKRGSS